MSNSKEQISSIVLMFAIGSFILSSTLLVGYITKITTTDTWIAVILGYIVSLIIVWIFCALFEKFPGKSIIEINDIVFGKIIGKIISILYIYYFFSLTFLNVNIAGEFVTSSLMPETPKAAVLILFVIICAYSVRKGLETMTRYSVVFFIIASIILILNSVLLIKDMKLSNFFPIFDLPIINYVHATHNISILCFCNIIIFSMFLPSLKNPKNIKKPFFYGLLMGGAIMLFISLRDISVLGPTISLMSNPSYTAIRLVNIAGVLTRMELFYAVIIIMLLFFKVSILLYATIKAITQIFNIESYKTFVPIISTAVISFALIAFKSSVENAYNAANIAPVLQTLFELILPLITLIIASIRGFSKSEVAKTK